jgi:hypothetical protein
MKSSIDIDGDACERVEANRANTPEDARSRVSSRSISSSDLNDELTCLVIPGVDVVFWNVNTV